MFVFTIISHGVVLRADILPHEYIALRPMMGKSVLQLKLMGEKKLQQFLALLLGNIVDAHCISGIGVDYVSFCDRMLQKHR